MSQLTLSQVHEVETTHSDWNRLLKLGGITAFIQLGCLLFSLIALTMVGGEPATAQETFTILQTDRLMGLLRLDFATLVMIALFPFVAIALYGAFRKIGRADPLTPCCR